MCISNQAIIHYQRGSKELGKQTALEAIKACEEGLKSRQQVPPPTTAKGSKAKGKDANNDLINTNHRVVRRLTPYSMCL